MPGCNFAATDRELFDELAAAVLQGRLSSGEARTLAAEAQQVLRAGSYVALMSILTARLPALTPVQAAIAHSPRSQRRTLTMLRIILEAQAVLETTTQALRPDQLADDQS